MNTMDRIHELWQDHNKNIPFPAELQKELEKLEAQQAQEPPPAQDDSPERSHPSPGEQEQNSAPLWDVPHQELMKHLLSLGDQVYRLDRNQRLLLRHLRKVPSQYQGALTSFFRGFGSAILLLPALALLCFLCALGGCYLAEFFSLPIPLVVGSLICLVCGGLLCCLARPWPSCCTNGSLPLTCWIAGKKRMTLQMILPTTIC